MMTFDQQYFTDVWHEIFSAYWSWFIDVWFDKLLVQQNINYLLYWFAVMLLIIFVVNFIFQNNK